MHTRAAPTIALCMIVRDEEEWIAQCLQSVAPIVSEIIVVDTGSKDRTPEIAAQLGANVLHMPWSDDFSAPRNFSLARASADWILVLDADEAIAAEDLSVLQAHTLESDCCFELAQRHYTNDVRLSSFQPVRGEKPQWEREYAGFFESALVRLFPNRRGIAYRGRIHELVEFSIREIPGLHIKRSPVRIQHYGHTPEVRRKKKKGELYTPLGVEKAKEEAADWKAFFELAIEHNCNGRLTDSVAAFKRSLELNPRHLDSWTNLGYVLCEIGHFQDAVTALETAIKIAPNGPEAWCNLGVVYMRCAEWRKAELALRRSVELRPHYINAYSNLVKVMAVQSRLSEAALLCRKILSIAPQHTPALLDLCGLYLQAGQPAAARRLLEAIGGQIDHFPTAIYYLAQSHRLMQESAEYLSCLSRFVEQAEKGCSDRDAARYLPQAKQELNAAGCDINCVSSDHRSTEAHMGTGCLPIK